MTVGEQLSLFDLSDPDPGPVREWSPPEIDGECEHCGTPISSRSPMDEVNHGTIQGTCMTRHLTRIHAWHAIRRLDPEQRRGDEKCMQHQEKRKPCPQECWDEGHEWYVARTTEAWGGDGWKEHS